MTKMKRPVLIEYIRKNDPFYEFALLDGYTTEQLISLKERIDAAKAIHPESGKGLGNLTNNASEKLN